MKFSRMSWLHDIHVNDPSCSRVSGCPPMPAENILSCALSTLAWKSAWQPLQLSNSAQQSNPHTCLPSKFGTPSWSNACGNRWSWQKHRKLASSSLPSSSAPSLTQTQVSVRALRNALPGPAGQEHQPKRILHGLQAWVRLHCGRRPENSPQLAEAAGNWREIRCWVQHMNTHASTHAST